MISRIGLRLGSLRLPLKKALLIASRVGARGVEIDVRHELRPADMSRTAIRDFRKILDDLNLVVCGAAFPTRRGFADAEGLDRRLEATHSAMQLAYALGGRQVILNIGRIPSEGTTAMGTLVESLSALAAASDRVGARLAALTDSRDAGDLSRLMNLLPPEAMGLAWHPGLLIQEKLSPTELLSELGPYVSYLYASDAVRDALQGTGYEMELGRGSAELPELLGRLEEFGYRGWITIDRRESLLSEQEAANAVAYLTSL